MSEDAMRLDAEAAEHAVTGVGETRSDEAARARRHARLVHRFLALAGIACVPLLFTTGAVWQAVYGAKIAEPVVLIPLLALIWLRLQEAQERLEVRFWQFLVAAFGVWLLTIPASSLAGLAFSGNTELAQHTANLPFALVYAFLIAALVLHPHVENDPVTFPLRMLEWSGTAILVLGLMFYLLAAPALLDSQSSGIWSSSLVLWLALDSFLIAWLGYLRSAADEPAWRRSYGWLLGAAAIWTFGDLVSLMIHGGVLADPGRGTALDAVWLLAFCAVGKSTEFHTPLSAGQGPAVPARPPLGMGPLVLYTSLPLLLHTLLHRFGSVDPELQALREGVALSITVILTGMTRIYYRLFRREADRLAAEESRAREALAHRAFHDELTGLPNRELFTDRLHMAIADAVRNGQQCAVLFCDLDQFKVINDSLGHDAGDQTLVATAERLLNAVRQCDTVARLGGDEFAVLLTGIHGSRDAAYHARKLLGAVSKPLSVGGKSHTLTASVGVAVYPEDGDTEETLLRHADTAMYQSKIHGRNTYRLFTEAMNLAAKERLIIEQGLRAGLLEDQFAVFYQPVVSLDSGYAAGYEALVRWEDPQRGYVLPASFIDVAEQTGLIVPIGRWVLERACAWAAQHPPVNGAPPLISVNISARQLREPHMAAHISRVLDKTGLPPSRLQLEITESAVLARDECLAAMTVLRGLGVSIAIDDFGTGYSVLGRLQELPVDTIKIDHSLVRGIAENSVSEAIVEAIVGMAAAMEITVVAEGVESASELAVITRAGCHAAQGHFFCKPLAADDLANWFSEPGSAAGLVRRD